MATSKVREELAQQFLAALNQGQLPWHKCWSQALPMNAVTGKSYRGVNALMLSLHADKRQYTDTRWCTYRQAQEKGWQVRKGEKGVRVEYWACYDTKEKKLLSWDDVRQKLKADPDYEKRLQLRCRCYTVFNAEQIDGVPAQQRTQTDIGHLRAQRDTLVRNMGIGYQEGGIRAYYSPGTDTVTLPPESTFDDTYSYMATFLHECGHASGHPNRLNRDLLGGFGSESYAREELRAEIASAFTAQSIGLQLTDEQLQYQTQQHAAYLQHWASILRDAPEELFRAIKDAEAISDYLIEKGEFEMKQLFKAETVQQRKIMDWLMEQGITGADIAEVQLTAPALVRLTNPAGQYMDVYCGKDYNVRILDVSEEQEAALQRLFWDETNDPETQEWRENLTADEAAMVEQWDAQTAYALEEISPGSTDLRLRFHGYGKIRGYSSAADRPWQAQISRIREVVVGDGITEVGRNVLSDLPSLEKLSWPRATQGIGHQHLESCPELKQINFTGNGQVWRLYSPGNFVKASERYPGFTVEQLEEISAGYQNGLTDTQIAIYAKPEFDSAQMNSLRYCIAGGLSPEALAVIADPRFGPVQMDIIHSGFQFGMSIDQVRTFAKPEIPPNEMLDAYWKIREDPSWTPPLPAEPKEPPMAQTPECDFEP